jgi:hypothetical protein
VFINLLTKKANRSVISTVKLNRVIHIIDCHNVTFPYPFSKNNDLFMHSSKINNHHFDATPTLVFSFGNFCFHSLISKLAHENNSEGIITLGVQGIIPSLKEY